MIYFPGVDIIIVDTYIIIYNNISMNNNIHVYGRSENITISYVTILPFHMAFAIYMPVML